MAEKRSNQLEGVKKLEREIGLPDGWFTALLSEDSQWAFIIKLHALMEAVVAHLIDEKLGRPELRGYLDRLNMGGQTGKVELGKVLTVLEPTKHVRFITTLSMIRNYCIHDVRNVSFEFDQYIDQLDRSDRRKVLGTFEPFLPQEIRVKDKNLSRDEFVRTEMQVAFWAAASLVLAELYDRKELAKYFRELRSGAAAAFTVGGLVGLGKGLLHVEDKK